MSLLTIVQDASLALGLASPSAVVSSQTQMLALVNQEGKDLASRSQWWALRRRNTFTLSTAAVNQGAMNSTVVTAGDFDYMIPDTFWNLGDDQIIEGPMEPGDEEEQVAIGVSGPFQQWTLRGGDLYIYPQPTVADTVTFQYMSKFWCKSSGGTKKAAFSVDTDLGILSEDLLTLGLIWRWKRANGLDYAQEFATYEARVTDTIAREVPSKSIRMDGPARSYAGITLPIGNWPL